MKKLIESIRNTFTARHEYNATMLIAGQQLTTKIIAKDLAAAERQADIIVDDCGFVLSVEAI